ncbi:Citrate lyase alpha chain [Koleobacter methoxysyntrophicus]|uniref:Citrate lyase alpha chain n=1 Tax=Koleobacter methoxysyntrophicus TaxID=2751313 RepID=A0A8A0RLC0_9FIRM|nr:citrate lyase subunit alpha [Koleobacter methoxysyntrophicus]QSQ09211.1 Citrate lyase alpha chain [Koleobacter methoxysyntrophicus]
MKKLVGSLKEAIKLCGLEDGMTVSFHHHLRNGDYVLNMVMDTIAELGYKEIKVAASAVFPVHEPLINHIKQGVVTQIDTNYMSGPVGEAISRGLMSNPVVFRTHGGRPRAIETGELPIDVAFIAAPSSDCYGNINGVDGPSACGSLGYAFPDAMHAEKVVVITDNLVNYPLTPISIDQTRVDYVVVVDSIGDPKGIVSGSTRITRDPVGLTIARYAAEVIEHSGLLNDGFSFQTGAGGASLAAAYYLKKFMKEKGITGSFGLGGITGYFVELLEEGLFKTLLDVQCFDLDAVRSIKANPNHQEISASFYANPESKGCAVDKLDIVILGATEIDTSFNVNVHTDSNGIIMGGSGGHSDTAAGSKLALIVAPLIRARLPVLVDRVLTITTPGDTVDVLVTERGISVNPKNEGLRERLTEAGLPVVDIHELKKKAEALTGKPNPIKTGGKVVAHVEYRDGRIIDTIKNTE